MTDRPLTRRWLWIARSFAFPLLLLSALLLALPRSARTAAPADAWWDGAWGYRRPLTITPADSTPLDAGYTVSAALNSLELISQNKLRADGDDLRVLYWDGVGWVELDRRVEDLNTDHTQVWFKTPVPIVGSDDNAYLYYGNPSATSPPDDWAAVYAVGDDFSDGALATGLSTSESVSITITETGGALLIDMVETDANPGPAGIVSAQIPDDKNFASGHRITRQTDGSGQLNLASVVQNAVTPIVASNSDFNKTQRVIFSQEADGSIGLSYLDDQGIWRYWDSNGAAWVTTPTVTHVGSVGLAYEAVVVGDGIQVSFSLRDQDGTLLTESQPVPWAQIADNDKGEPFWLLWGEPYTNRDYMDAASDWFWMRAYESPEPTVLIDSEETAASISIAKTPVTDYLPEPGGSVSFTVQVANTGAEPVTVTSLVDDPFGDLTVLGDCQVGGEIAPAAQYQCSFEVEVSGNAFDVLTDTVTVWAEDSGGAPATASATAAVTLTNILPSIAVTKTAVPETLPEPSGLVSFTVQVANTGLETVTLASLTDDPLGDLAGWGDCQTGLEIAPDDSYQCTFEAEVSGNAFDTVTDTVTAVAQDDDGFQDEAVDEASVSFTNVDPSIVVTKTAVPASVPEPGGLVEFTVEIGNTGAEPVTVTSLIDDPLGEPPGLGECQTGANINPDDVYRCTFTADVSGNPGDVVADTIAATAVDDENFSAQSADDATVTITDASPSIEVNKMAWPDVMNEPGGWVTFTVRIDNTGPETLTLISLIDDVYGDLDAEGSCATPQTIPVESSYECTFSQEIIGTVGNVHTDVVTGTVQDDEGNTVPQSDSATVYILEPGIPDLLFDKDDERSTVYAGDALTYTLVVSNVGDTLAADVIITDTLPDYVQYNGCLYPLGGGCGLTAEGTVVFTVSTIAPANAAVAALQIKVDELLPAQAITIGNHAVLTATYLAEPLLADDINTIGTLPDLSLSVSHKPPIFYPGELMTYTIAYSNTGHMDAESVTISTVLPPDTYYVGGGWELSDGRNYRYTVGQLEALETGSPVEFVVGYPVNDPQEISQPEFDTPFSIAGDGGVGGDANPGDNDASAFVGVPDLVVADSYVRPAWVRPDVPITFTVVIENQGTGVAQNLQNGTGFYVDVFPSAIASYPFEHYSPIYGTAGIVPPGTFLTVTIPYTLTRQEIDSIVDGFYVKLDNFQVYTNTQGVYPLTCGLVPEYDEMNNVAGPLALTPDEVYDAYLPLILR